MVEDPSPSVLLVDDEADVRSSLRRVLKLDGYDVVEADSLASMMAREDLANFCCIILDRKLADGNADDVLPELSRRTPDTDIVIVTGYTDLQGTLAAMRHGAEDYLLKPVNPDDLRAALRRTIRLKEMKAALRESEARHRGILETASVGILTLDEAGAVESVNQATETIFGLASADLLARPLSTLLASSHRASWEQSFRLVLGDDATGTIGQELLARRKGGEPFPVAVTLSRVDLPKRSVVTVIIEDITERKQLEKDVLRASEEERHRIAQDLHDGLASHLTGISLICRMLAGQLSEEHTKTANQIGDLIDEAIQQTRAVARGLYPVEDDPEGLMNSLGQLAARLRKDLKIDCRFECIKPVQIGDNATATHLYRIAQEAVNNSLRHGKADQIFIELARGEDALSLRVEDNGCGMKEQESSLPRGIGLRTMAYRCGLLQGTCQFGPGIDGGTEVLCVIPMKSG